MPTITTEHRNDGSTVRQVETDDDVYEFDIDDSGVMPTHSFRGDGRPPQEVADALAEWTARHHDVDDDSQDEQSTSEESE